MTRLEDELSAIYARRRVDLRTAEELSPYFRQQVLRGARVEYVVDDARLGHMLDAARAAIEFLSDEPRAALDTDAKLALARLLEILGEAASAVSPELRAENPNIPWREPVGMRNRLIHGCAGVNLDIVWLTIREDLPGLVQDLETLCGESR